MIEPAPAALDHRLAVAADVPRRVQARRDRVPDVELLLLAAGGRERDVSGRRGRLARLRHEAVVVRVAHAEIQRQPPAERPAVLQVQSEVVSRRPSHTPGLFQTSSWYGVAVVEDGGDSCRLARRYAPLCVRIVRKVRVLAAEPVVGVVEAELELVAALEQIRLEPASRCLCSDAAGLCGRCPMVVCGPPFISVTWSTTAGTSCGEKLQWWLS